jgi:hypothetical protein
MSPLILILGSLAGYGVMAIWFSLLPNVETTPVLDIRAFTPTLGQGLLYALLVLLLFVFYLLLYRQVYRGDRGLRLWQMTAVTVLLGLPLLVTYPINANDVFRYMVRGRISSVYGANPYAMAPDEFAADRYVDYAGEWRAATSPYGPLWEGTAALIARASGDNLLLALVLFKLLGLAAVLATTAVLWLLLADVANPSRRAALALLWAWNPAILLTFVANAHNDALMMACLLLGWLILRRGYAGPGMLFVLAAALIKPIALLAAPLIFLYAWRQTMNPRDKAMLAIWSILGGGIMTWLAFLPYGDPTVLAPRLINEAAGGASFSPFTLFFLIADQFDWQLPMRTIITILPLLFLLYYAWLSWRTWHGRAPENAIPRAFFGYLLQALNFRIWYASWPFPWLILDARSSEAHSQRALEAGVWFLLTSQLSVLIYGHIRLDLLGGDLLWSHVFGVVFVFFAPFLLARVVSLTPHAQEGINAGQQS